MVLKNMNFPDSFSKLIMRCISSVSYSILINGSLGQSFTPHRGLRQGDPLSPYLFILCVEILSCMLKKAEELRLTYGIKIARSAPSITHRFFANDSIIFSKASMRAANTITQIIQAYEKASGQQVNLEKTELTFSKNVPEDVKNSVQERIGVEVAESYEKYLGLPTVVGKPKKVIFARLRDKIWRKIKRWKERFLSQAGKEILIKTVAQAIPNYIMSCFKIPVGNCLKMELLLSNFWWAEGDDKKKIHWVVWETLCKSKKDGGLGFRQFESLNDALLGKQCWRWIKNEQSMVSKTLKARYYPNRNLFSAKLGFQPSFTWKNIWNSRNIVEEGARWRVHSGTNIDVWKDRWLPEQHGGRVWSPRPAETDITTVSHLIDHDRRTWDRKTMYNIFYPFETEQICRIPIVHRISEDVLYWPWEKDHNYSVRSAYHLIQSKKLNMDAGPSNVKHHWDWIWKLNVPPKIRLFL